MVAVLYSPSVMPNNRRRTIQELISHAKEHRCLDNEHRCLLLMEFLMHRDTVTRSWGPLLCHSSTTITSCCSMIMHGPHVASICTQFLEAENIPVLAWPAYSPELDNAITKFNNEMHSAENWVLNPVILNYWHNLPILILCSALLQFVLLKALYK